MIIEIKGKINSISKMNKIEGFFKTLEPNSIFVYKGFNVKIDPTLSYSSNDLLIRWVDLNEGFNDKIIYKSLSEFLNEFKLKNA